MFLPKMFLTTRSISTILPKTFRQQWIQFFANSEKVIKRLDISWKKTQNVLPETLDSVVISLLETFSENPKNFCSKTRKGEKIYDLFPKKLFKTFLWTRRILFWQPCRTFRQRFEAFLLKVRNWWKILLSFKNNFSSARSPAHGEVLFEVPDEMLLPRSQKTFRSRYGEIKKFKIFKEFFSLVHSSGYLKIRYDDTFENFLHEVPNCLLELRNILR